MTPGTSMLTAGIIIQLIKGTVWGPAWHQDQDIHFANQLPLLFPSNHEAREKKPTETILNL